MNCLRLCFWNANGIRQHKNELEYFLATNDIDIMLVSETHLTSRSLFKISGYELYDTKDPRGRACGGSAILIKARLKHYVINDVCKDYLQATSICLEDFCLNVTSVYFPPRFSITENQYTQFFNSLGPRFLAAGDYNAKHTFWGSRLATPRGRVLYDTISKMKLDIISSGHPTYWPTDRSKIPDVIDFGVTNGIPKEAIKAESSLELSSDHSPTIVTLSLNNSTFSPATNFEIFSNRINWLKYKKYLSTHLTEKIRLKSNEDINYSINSFEENLRQAVHHATTVIRQVRNNRIYSADIEGLLLEKRRAQREWQQYRSPQSKNRLREYTRRLRQMLEAQRVASLNKYLEELDASPQTEYSLWRATRNLKRPVISRPPLRTLYGEWAKSCSEKGNLFSYHLKNVFKPNPPSYEIELPPLAARPAVQLYFNINEIMNAIANLNVKKAPGYDKITNKMLLELPSTAVRIIMFIFNAILRNQYYPSNWKTSLVIMIPKPGKDPTQVESYRPISLLPVMSKLFEKLLMSKLCPILYENQCIPNHQFGFRKKHSTVEQTHRLVQAVRKSFEDKKYCSALFIDVSQAFDKVWHTGLIHKLKAHLPLNCYNILQNYLTNRSFIIKEGDYFSSPQAIDAGVPQGSILGPILYLLYTSDMPTSDNILTSTFADDTAFLSIHENPKLASQLLQTHILKLEKWLIQWRIKVNEQKCIHVTFTLRRESCPPIRINNQQVPQHSEVKYLGIHLDRRLTWSTHINTKLTQLKLKTAQLHWLIGRNSTLTLDCKLLLYKSILKPIWCYGLQLWGTASSSNIERIQRFQNKILRMITAAPWYIKNSNIHKDLNMPLVKAEISKYAEIYLRKLGEHPNPLARNILNYGGHFRLKKRDTAALIPQT